MTSQKGRGIPNELGNGVLFRTPKHVYENHTTTAEEYYRHVREFHEIKIADWALDQWREDKHLATVTLPRAIIDACFTVAREMFIRDKSRAMMSIFRL